MFCDFFIVKLNFILVQFLFSFESLITQPRPSTSERTEKGWVGKGLTFELCIKYCYVFKYFHLLFLTATGQYFTILPMRKTRLRELSNLPKSPTSSQDTWSQGFGFPSSKALPFCIVSFWLPICYTYWWLEEITQIRTGSQYL